MLHRLQARKVIEPFSIQLEYENGIVFDVAGEFEPGEPMTWEGFHWEPGHNSRVDIKSVCLVGTKTDLIDVLSIDVLEWIEDQIDQQMEDA